MYQIYALLFHAYFWMPVFFLYFSEQLPLGRVLQLEAIYYLAVVAMEVPSGYFSDRFGRRRTLLISAGSLIAAYTLFVIGGSFAVFAAAQILLGVGLSFASGTDTALHFDSLSALGRADEYPAREARAARNALLGGAIAALLGGVAGVFELRYAYALSLGGAVMVLALVSMMVEPPAEEEREQTMMAPGNFAGQLRRCISHLSNPLLRWMFAFAVLMTVINHIPYEVYQPYLDLLVKERDFELPGTGTPLVTAVLTAAAMGLAALAASMSVRLGDRIGVTTTLLLTIVLQIIIMAVMAWVLHELVVLLILLRSVPAGLMKPLVNASITPRLPQSIRATYLSLQSLAGRLGFSAFLLAMSLGLSTTGRPDFAGVQFISLSGAALGAIGLALLWITASSARRRG